MKEGVPKTTWPRPGDKTRHFTTKASCLESARLLGVLALRRGGRVAEGAPLLREYT